TPVWSELVPGVMLPQPVMLPMRLWPPGPSVMIVPREGDWQSVAVPLWILLAAMMVLVRVVGLEAYRPPPPLEAVLAVMVVLVMVAPEPGVRASAAMPPPWVSATLLAMVLLVMCSVEAPVAPVPVLVWMAPPSLLSLLAMVEFWMVSAAEVSELSGVVLRIAALGMPVLPVTVSAASSRVPWLVTVGDPLQLVRQLRVTPETIALAPGVTLSGPCPASIVIVRAVAPLAALIVTLADTIPIPG